MKINKFENYIKEALVRGGSPDERSIDLRGPGGNSYAILGMASNLCNQLKEVDPEKYDWERINKEMTSGDYKNLVNTFEEYFGDYVTIYNADVIDESVVNEKLFNKRKRYDEKEFNSFIDNLLKKQVGVEKKLDGWEIKIVDDGILKLYGDDGSVHMLYLDTPETADKDERFFMFHPKSGGGGVHKISKKIAQNAYDKLIRFADYEVKEEFKNPFKKKVQVEPNYPIEEFTSSGKEKIIPEEGYDLNRFYNAINKLYDKGQNKRKENLSNLFFRNFLGKELLNSTIEKIIVDVNIESDFYGMTIYLEDGTKIHYNFSKDDKRLRDYITIEPVVDSQKINKEINNDNSISYNDRSKVYRETLNKAKEDAKKVSRKDARLIGQITKRFNPDTKYATGTGDLIVKEYESRIQKFNDYLNK